MPSTEYNAWVSMRQRCLNPNHEEYFRYGGRGITICDRWLESYQNFYEDLGDKPSPELSLDRMNNDLGYYKENCEWRSKGIQSYNQRISVDNSTGVIGVYKEKQTSMWKAYIRVSGRQITLGRFKDFFEACCSRKSSEIFYYGDIVGV